MISKSLTAASTRPIILGVLQQGNSYGYLIIKKIREMSGGRMEWSDGMLYPVIHRLEKEGLITSEWKQAESGRRRKYYRIRQEGRTELNQQQSQWQLVNGMLNKLLEKSNV